MAALYPPDELDQIQLAWQTGRPSTFRVNTLKAAADEVAQQLRTDGFELESVPWLPEAFILRSRTLGELTEHPLYTSGQIYVQGLSSMVPALVLDPQPEEQVLDVAAAPGSKTTQMAAQMRNQGTIIANDTSRVRLYKLAANLKMQGVEIVTTMHSPGELLWQKLVPVFDKALVDVPCSMEGRIRLDRFKTYQNWSLKKIKELAHRQRALLHSAISLTKPGGVVVYSTCTLAPEENEGVIDWAVTKLAGQVALEPIVIPDVTLQPAVTEWEGRTYRPEVNLCGRVRPTETMEGFFVAKLRKLV